VQQKTEESDAPVLELIPLLPEGRSAPIAPSSRTGRFAGALRQRWPFLVFVALPTVLAALYYALLAADRYEAESRFVVRSPTAASTSQLASLVQGSSIVRSADDAHIVHAYIGSRDAVRKLVEDTGLMHMLSVPWSDVLWRYPGLIRMPNQERLWKHMQSLVSIDYDQTTGISTL